MLSLLKKLFAKKEEKPVAPWPFPTGVVKNQKPVAEPAAVAKTSTRKPRAKKVQ
jgi:hypothetical protein